ncbi:amino acid adenylation domain-containing protein [Kalymmatonema gypsitolerans NIES-4073]|nr:amino acid adenylation domain-containing protein [Scytonema sp. NIES-4073]
MSKVQKKSSSKAKNIELIYPLSPLQQGMLFHSLYAPSSGVYFEQMTLTLTGNLHISAFTSAWQKVVDRHCVLRTFFVWENRSTPLQIVLKKVNLPWNNLDWQGLSPTQQQQQLSDLLQTQRQQGFQFDKAPLMEFTLIKLTENTYTFIWNHHHIILDGWCLPILFQEVFTFYQAELTGETCYLPTPCPYRDYIAWLNSQDKTAATEFWRQTLQGFSAPTPLRVNKLQSQHHQAFSDYQELELRLSPQLTHNLQSVAQQHHVTLSTIVQAAWALLLSRYSGEDDVVFGVTVSGRTADLSGVENMVGLLINTLPLRLFISPQQQLIAWLEQIQQLMVELQHYSYTPLVEVQANSEVTRGIPLFESIVVFENYPVDSSLLNEGTSLQFSQLKGFEQTNYPLTVTAAPGDELLVNISYDTVRFEEDTIRRMLGHLQTIFSAIADNPVAAVGELPLLSEAELHQLLVEWNETATEYPTDKCIHQLFEQQVERTPQSVAVVFDTKQLTYQQLNQRANQLAHHLQTLGVGPEVLVGICVERSIEMVVGLLAILKAGGAYIPLDPNYPQERLSYMLADSGVEVLLTQQSLLESLSHNQARVVCLDTDWGETQQHTQDNLGVGVCTDNLAYVIYTSGSTGQPKGVLVTHQSLVNHNSAIALKYNLKAWDKVLQFAALSFDVAIEEIFPSWLSGATVVLPPQEMFASFADLVEFLKVQRLTVLNLPAAFWHEWVLDLSQSQEDLPKSLRLVVVGSEQIQWSRVAMWQKYVGRHVKLYHAYGSTEATITATVYEPDLRNQEDKTGGVSIGRPIANTQIYILDKHLQPVPIGVPGELYIGGDGLAVGYLNRPQLTQEKFIANPLCDSKCDRLYKTGDLARYLSDGNIEFLGRIDNQVKVRGFRIELGEIEAVLNTHPQVQQSVVIATEDLSGNKRLVAYVVSLDQSLTSSQIREFLKQKLPEYMVPSAFVTLDTLPLTANGKVDRLALPAPDGEITRVREYVEPRTAIEQSLTNIWQELLLVEKVSIYDNFFEIGGDSILSIQVVSRAKNTGIQITPKQIFQHQTIAELARVANTTVGASAQQGIVTGVAPLTPIQHLFFLENKQEPHHYNQSVLLHLPNNVKPELLTKAVAKLLEHHDALRLRFNLQASEHKQRNHGLDDVVPFSVVDISSTPKHLQPQALSKIATEFQASLNLSDGPIMQVVMFKLDSQGEKRLLIIVHHLAVDGVSWRILLSDLETIYQQLIAQEPIQLTAKTTAFIDWAEKLNNYAQSEIIKQELDYWLNQPWSKTTPLPLDSAYKQENTNASAAEVSVKLSQEETRILLGSVNEAYNTQINDILLSALVVSFKQWTGNSTVVINLEGHGREELFEDVDLSRTVGWFTSLFPVLLQLPSSDQPESVIKSIKEQLRAIPNRGIGYGILRYLCKERTVNQQLQTIPTPEISFNYLGQFDQVQSQTGWKFASESTGDNYSLKQSRDNVLNINSLVIEGELQINLTYSKSLHTRATMEKLAQSYVQSIRSIIEHCQLEDAFGYTPSDFPDAQLNQLELDELLSLIKTKNIESIYPLSPLQQGMLFHSLYAPSSGVYFEQMTLTLTGNLNISAFTSAWQKVVDRHSVLRTFFVWENRSTPLQIVLKKVNLPWNNLDWQGLSPTQQQQQLSDLLQTQRQQGFQFDKAPLMEFTLIKLTENTYTFIWNHHHIILDGWCLPILFQEVFTFYQAELTGETCYLPTPCPYRDYIAWLNSQDKNAATEFWRQTLQGFSAPTPLRVNKLQSQHHQAFSDYQELELRLSPQLTHNLQSVAQQHHVTLSTIVQAAWALLLSRYSGEDDVVFGVTVSGRTADLSGVENMVGLLINTLPLRLFISPQQQLIAWLEQIQQLMVELQHYSYTPLVEVQANSEVTRGIPLFESIVVFENYPVDSSLLNEATSLQFSQLKGFEQTNYPLTVTAAPGDELLVNISYDTVRFEEDTIRRMLGHLQTIFSAIADNPVAAVGELPLLSEAELHQLLVEWNETATEYPTDKCIHQLFEQQVERTPQSVAVVFEEEQLTYHSIKSKSQPTRTSSSNTGSRTRGAGGYLCRTLH